MRFEYPAGATPLDPDEAAGLIPEHITTQGELNAWEEANIIEGERWAFNQTNSDMLNEGFIRLLHRKMFDQTWVWAGTFRASNKNIGVDWTQAPTQLKNLLDNARYQLDNSVFSNQELAVRLHHQMVFIHPFPNGNGRHARLLADLVMVSLGEPRFTWGSHQPISEVGNVRSLYIDALREADRGDMSSLLEFSRS